MSKVLITLNASTNQIVTAYKDKPTYGYIQLTQDSVSLNGAWLKESKRSTLVRAEVSLLNKFIEANKSLQLPGNIIVKEFKESELPQAMADKYLAKNQSYEQAIQQYVKRAGKDAPELTIEGQRILRFSEWDITGNEVDSIIEHDNQEQLSQWRAQVKAQASLLPG
jgi:hypothetical protein